MTYDLYGQTPDGRDCRSVSEHKTSWRTLDGELEEKLGDRVGIGQFIGKDREMSNDTISIADWSEDIIADMRRFADHWNALCKRDDPSYPDRMTHGDWDEQFIAFVNSKSDGE